MKQRRPRTSRDQLVQPVDHTLDAPRLVGVQQTPTRSHGQLVAEPLVGVESHPVVAPAIRLGGRAKVVVGVETVAGAWCG